MLFEMTEQINGQRPVQAELTKVSEVISALVIHAIEEQLTWLKKIVGHGSC